jgi:hypothetical protein
MEVMSEYFEENDVEPVETYKQRLAGFFDGDGCVKDIEVIART